MWAIGRTTVILSIGQVLLYLLMLPWDRRFNPASYAGSSGSAGFASSQHASTGISTSSLVAHTLSPTVSTQRLGQGVRSPTVEVDLDLEKGPSLVRVAVLRHLLKDYPDQAAANYMLHGLFSWVFHSISGRALFCYVLESQVNTQDGAYSQGQAGKGIE